MGARWGHDSLSRLEEREGFLTSLPPWRDVSDDPPGDHADSFSDYGPAVRGVLVEGADRSGTGSSDEERAA